MIDSDHILMGKIIEVDESKFRYTRQYKRGRHMGKHPWIVGFE